MNDYIPEWIEDGLDCPHPECSTCEGSGVVACSCDDRGCSRCVDCERTCLECDGCGYIAEAMEAEDE